ncbi:MAG: hypothetical protein H6Q72_4486 [Firmicutes bacterium]|nr:hypothetical protein [Bacillota bacterium]
MDILNENWKKSVNGSTQPTLMFNDLKLESDQRGEMGFWIESGTIGYFNNLKITRSN